MKYNRNLRCDEGKEGILRWLTDNNIWCENTKYPNLISLSGICLRVICPYTRNPMFLAEGADKKQADLYVGFYLKNGRILVGFAYPHDFEFYPAVPEKGWQNPTRRVCIAQLQPVSVLLTVLQSNGGSYV